MGKYTLKIEPVALLPIGAGIKPSIRSTCGVNCITEKEAAKYAPESVLKLYCIPPDATEEITKLKQERDGLLDELGNIGAMIPMHGGGTFVNDPPDAITDALASYLNAITNDRHRLVRIAVQAHDSILSGSDDKEILSILESAWNPT